MSPLVTGNQFSFFQTFQTERTKHPIIKTEKTPKFEIPSIPQRCVNANQNFQQSHFPFSQSSSALKSPKKGFTMTSKSWLQTPLQPCGVTGGWVNTMKGTLGVPICVLDTILRISSIVEPHCSCRGHCIAA